MDIIKREEVHPIHCRAGDTLHVTYTGKEGEKHVMEPHEFKEDFTVDTLLLVKVVEELGLKKGIGVILGESDSSLL